MAWVVYFPYITPTYLQEYHPLLYLTDLKFVRYTPLPGGHQAKLLCSFQKLSAHPINSVTSTDMGRVATSILKPGMVLSKPVCNDYRQQLAEAGTILDRRVISVLQTWGVIDVDVQGVSEPTLQEVEE